MARPPALTPQQQQDVRARLAAGEGIRAMAREFGVGTATIMRQSAHSGQIRDVAEKVAIARVALAALPPQQQHQAVTLAERLCNISADLAAAAAYGAATAHHLSRIARNQAVKVSEDDPMESQDVLQGIAALNRLANDSASIGMQLVAGNKALATPADAHTMPPGISPDEFRAIAIEIAART